MAEDLFMILLAKCIEYAVDPLFLFTLEECKQNRSDILISNFPFTRQANKSKAKQSKTWKLIGKYIYIETMNTITLYLFNIEITQIGYIF